MKKQSDLQKLINLQRRRLQKLQEQQAIQGANTPPEILLEIEDIEEKIAFSQTEPRQEEDSPDLGSQSQPQASGGVHEASLSKKNGEASMSKRSVYAIIGLFIGVGVDLAVNLLAAAIQQRAFTDQFGPGAIWWLAGLAALGLVVGYWLAGETQVSTAAIDPATAAGKKAKTVTVTRLRALLSYVKTRGRGIHLSDVFSFGSKIDIDTRD